MSRVMSIVGDKGKVEARVASLGGVEVLHRGWVDAFSYEPMDPSDLTPHRSGFTVSARDGGQTYVAIVRF